MFKKYKYVYMVYKEKSFTKAAEKLFISQPSLSAAVRSVEYEIGAPIFDRSGNGITLTEIGHEYICAAEHIMSIENDFTNRINDIYNLEVGRIRIGGTNYLSSYVLPKIINKFSELYPNIDVTLTEANSGVLLEMINNEEIDIIVDNLSNTCEEYVGYPLADEHVLLCVPADNPINKGLERYAIASDSIYDGEENALSKDPVPIDIFKNEKFILLKNGNDMHNRALSIFGSKAISPNVLYNVDQLNISYFLAESGIGLCFVTDTLFRFGKFRNEVKLYNVDKKYCTRTLYIGYKKNKYCTSAMTKFINISKEVFNII